MALLEVDGLDLYYGDAQALDGVSIAADEGEIVAIVGSNGAGKSSLIRTIAGIETPRRGTVRYRGRDITGLPSHAVCELGVGQVAEGRQVFPTLTVRENLEMGAYSVKAAEQVQQSLERVFGLFPKLKERQKQLAGTFSGGEQQMLVIGRALMSEPRFLMLDEPSLGLQPSIVANVFESLKILHGQGVTILLVEQNVRKSLEIAQRGYVLEHGRVVLAGDSKSLLADEGVRRAYLGI